MAFYRRALARPGTVGSNSSGLTQGNNFRLKGIDNAVKALQTGINSFANIQNDKNKSNALSQIVKDASYVQDPNRLRAQEDASNAFNKDFNNLQFDRRYADSDAAGQQKMVEDLKNKHFGSEVVNNMTLQKETDPFAIRNKVIDAMTAQPNLFNADDIKAQAAIQDSNLQNFVAKNSYDHSNKLFEQSQQDRKDKKEIEAADAAAKAEHNDPNSTIAAGRFTDVYNISNKDGSLDKAIAYTPAELDAFPKQVDANGNVMTHADGSPVFKQMTPDEEKAFYKAHPEIAKKTALQEKLGGQQYDNFNNRLENQASQTEVWRQVAANNPKSKWAQDQLEKSIANDNTVQSQKFQAIQKKQSELNSQKSQLEIAMLQYGANNTGSKVSADKISIEGKQRDSINENMQKTMTTTASKYVRSLTPEQKKGVYTAVQKLMALGYPASKINAMVSSSLTPKTEPTLWVFGGNDAGINMEKIFGNIGKIPESQRVDYSQPYIKGGTKTSAAIEQEGKLANVMNSISQGQKELDLLNRSQSEVTDDFNSKAAGRLRDSFGLGSKKKSNFNKTSTSTSGKKTSTNNGGKNSNEKGSKEKKKTVDTNGFGKKRVVGGNTPIDQEDGEDTIKKNVNNSLVDSANKKINRLQNALDSGEIDNKTYDALKNSELNKITQDEIGAKILEGRKKQDILKRKRLQREDIDHIKEYRKNHPDPEVLLKRGLITEADKKIMLQKEKEWLDKKYPRSKNYPR